MKIISVLLFLCTFSTLPCQASAPVTAEGVYAGYENKIIQVRIIDKASGAKASIGSGFVVSKDGDVVSNYHVVSELINRPGRYRAEYLRESGEHGLLTLLDIDVIHDLALLRSEELNGDFLRLADQVPRKGEKLYSFGNPLDLGLTIVEGLYNGLRARALYEKIHFTGSLNPGMSGGPALNGHGEVVGVNVSTAGNQVSFLVPVKFVKALVAVEHKAAPDAGQLLGRVRDQLMANQQNYIDRIFAQPLPQIDMGDYRLPGQPAPFFSCWGDTQPPEDKLYELAYHSCSSTDDIYLSRRQSSGIIRFRHELFSTDKIGPVRFYGMLESKFQQPNVSLGGDEDNLTNYQCQNSFVDDNDMDAKVVLCMRGYRKLEGLYDLFMTVSTLVKGDENLQSTLVMAGVSYDNGIRFSRAFIEAISRGKHE